MQNIIDKLKNCGLETELYSEIYKIGGEQALQRFIDLAVNNIKNRFEQLKDACIKSDYAALEGAAHSIRGSAMNLGNRDLALTAEKFELLAEKKEREAFQAICELEPLVIKIKALTGFTESDHLFEILG
ncbi:MAG TPA: Hpt domain-containing protein [Candidatus Marinimicrobia bacterium]|nr:Hpt domain-containing protein [Candidatus Neomarinimicrobiota bacterium]